MSEKKSCKHWNSMLGLRSLFPACYSSSIRHIRVLSMIKARQAGIPSTYVLYQDRDAFVFSPPHLHNGSNIQQKHPSCLMREHKVASKEGGRVDMLLLMILAVNGSTVPVYAEEL